MPVACFPAVGKSLAFSDAVRRTVDEMPGIQPSQNLDIPPTEKYDEYNAICKGAVTII